MTAEGESAGPVYAQVPWHIPRRQWRAILKRTWTAYFANHLGLLAAAVAFYAFLSFVPMLAAVVMTYGLVGDPEMVNAHMRTVTGLVPGEAAQLVNQQLLGLVSAAKSETGFGLVVALAFAIYGATRASSAIIEALNMVYRETEARGFLAFYRVSFGITLATILLVTAGIVAASILGLVEDFAAEIGGGTTFLLKTATWLGAALLVSLVFATIYRFAPNRRRARWQWLTAGSVGATLVWLLATFAMSLYVSRVGGYNETYGSLGAVVVFLLWLFVSSLVILVGAQLNAEAELQTTADTTVGAPAPAGRRGATVADEVSED